MEYKAHLRGVRIAPRKARLVATLVRGRLVQDALDILRFTNKKAAPMVSGLIKSAIANAKDVGNVDVDNLIVGEIFVNEGTTMKRFMPRAQGRAFTIRKRSSHISLSLIEI